MIRVLDAGPLTTVQDLGRPGYAHLGVPRSGALDRGALLAANALAGNEPGAAVLESTLQGPQVEFASETTFALTGAVAASTLDGQPVPHAVAVEARAGQTLAVGRTSSGMRTYLAVAGGIEAEPELGSRSTDVLTGLGPAPLQDGDEVAVGTSRLTTPASVPAGVSRHPDELVLELVLGPRAALFTAAAIEALTTRPFSVSPQSNRIGLRLRGGPPLQLREAGDLPSEGLVTGALQVPPSGEPILMLADHPTTGGYPVIAVASEHSLDVAAQLRPGTEVRFTVAG